MFGKPRLRLVSCASVRCRSARRCPVRLAYSLPLPCAVAKPDDAYFSVVADAIKKQAARGFSDL